MNVANTNQKTTRLILRPLLCLLSLLLAVVLVSQNATLAFADPEDGTLITNEIPDGVDDPVILSLLWNISTSTSEITISNYQLKYWNDVENACANAFGADSPLSEIAEFSKVLSIGGELDANIFALIPGFFGPESKITELIIDTTDDIPQSVLDYWKNPASGIADKIKDVNIILTLNDTPNSHAFADALLALNPKSDKVTYRGGEDPDISITANFGSFTGSGTLTAVIDGADAQLENFRALTLGDAIVDPSNYDKASGSTMLTLSESYLKGFDNGNYTFTAIFDAGQVPVTLTVDVPAPGLPLTGDNATAVATVCLLLLAGAVLLLSTSVLRHRKTR